MIGGNKKEIQKPKDLQKALASQPLSKGKDDEGRIQTRLQKLSAKYPERFKIITPMLKEDKENPLRLYKLLERTKTIDKIHKLEKNAAPAAAFTIILESDKLSVHAAALLAAIQGKPSAIRSIAAKYPEIMGSQYGKYLKPLANDDKSKSPSKSKSNLDHVLKPLEDNFGEVDVFVAEEYKNSSKMKVDSDPGLKPQEDYFGEIDIFISLAELGLSKDNVFMIDCLDGALVARGFTELAQDMKTSIFVVSGKIRKYSFLTIASWQRVYIFDLHGLSDANQDPILEEIRQASISEFRINFLKFLKNGQVSKCLVNGGGFKKLFREQISDSKIELGLLTNIIDVRIVFFEMLQDKEKGLDNEFTKIKTRILSKFHEYVETIYSRPLCHAAAAAASDWDKRPVGLYQQHYMALFAILALPVLERLEAEKVNYRKFKTYNDLHSAMLEIKSKFIAMKKKAQKEKPKK